MNQDKVSLPDRYKREILNIFEEISVRVSKKVNKDMENRVNVITKKIDGLNNNFEHIENITKEIINKIDLYLDNFENKLIDEKRYIDIKQAELKNNIVSNIKDSAKVITEDVLKNEEDIKKEIDRLDSAFKSYNEKLNNINENILSNLQSVSEFLNPIFSEINENKKRIVMEISQVLSHYNLDKYLEQLEEKQKVMLKRNNITFIILFVLLVANILIKLFL